MLEYEISRIIHELLPYISNTISVLTGIIVSNMFWKARIHRYAKTEIVETLEYQKNKIDRLEREIMEKDSIISDLRGNEKIVKIAALKIMGVTK